MQEKAKARSEAESGSKAAGKADSSVKFNHAEYVNRLAQYYANKLGWNRDMADEAAQLAAEVLRSIYGGSSHYIAANCVDREAIGREFNGKNIPDLARKHGVSQSTVRRILR